jgi:hypothetical protein
MRFWVAAAAVVAAVSSVGLAGGAPVAAASTAPVPSVLTCAGKVVVKPASYVLSCADANTYFTSIHWTTWTSRSATATATFVQNNCAPNCAAGKFIKHPATLTLSQPKNTKLGLLFAMVRYSYTVSAANTLPLTRLSSVR